MSKLGFAYAVIAAALFGIGGTFAQFLFTQRGVSMDWLVTMRLLVSGFLLLAFTCARDGQKVLAVWRDWPSLIVFGLVGMLGVQYTYMAAIEASNTATATVLQYTAPAMVAVWLTRKHTQASFPEIGRSFGGRDHSTAIHACQKVDWLVQTDAAVQAAVQAIETALGK